MKYIWKILCIIIGLSLSSTLTAMYKLEMCVRQFTDVLLYGFGFIVVLGLKIPKYLPLSQPQNLT